MPRAFGRTLILILISSAALYLVGNDRVDLWDRDEPRYAQTSRQMLESGDWVVPVFLDRVRTAKPVFIYWCQAVSMRICGHASPFAARLPSAIAMLLTLSIVAIALNRAIGPQRALWTVFILATSALTIAAAKMCITDSVLMLFITVAQLALAAIYVGNRSAIVPLVLWIAFGLAALTKGPVVLGVQLTTMLILAFADVRQASTSWRDALQWNHWRRAIAWWRFTRPALGIAIIAAILGPWLWMIERRSPGFLYTTITHDVWTRTIKPLEGHKGPPGFYLASVWLTFFPWSLLLPTAATLAFAHRNLPPIRFAIAAVAGPWLLMESVQTKLVHYVMPAFAPLAFLTADALVRCIRNQHDDLRRPIFAVAAGIWAAFVLVAGLLPWFVTLRFDHPPLLKAIMTLFSLAGIAYAAIVFLRIKRGQIAPAAHGMGGGMILVIAIFYGLYLPSAHFLWLPRQVASVLNQHNATSPNDVIMIDFKEDSLPFYHAGNSIRPRDDDFLAITPPQHWPRWIVLTRDIYEKLPPDQAKWLEVVDSKKGLAYADGGRRVEVLIARKREPQ